MDESQVVQNCLREIVGLSAVEIKKTNNSWIRFGMKPKAGSWVELKGREQRQLALLCICLLALLSGSTALDRCSVYPLSQVINAP